MYTDVTAYGKIITTPTISHCTSFVLLFMIKPQSCQEFLKRIFENTNIIVFSLEQIWFHATSTINRAVPPPQPLGGVGHPPQLLGGAGHPPSYKLELFLHPTYERGAGHPQL